MLTVQVEAKECLLCKCVFYKEKRNASNWHRTKCCSKRCAALHRGNLIGEWKNSSKTCATCGAVFQPRPGISKVEWRNLKSCSEECRRRSGRGYKIARNPMNPAECRTAGQRIRFLRLSKSSCGKKTVWSVRHMAKLAGCCDSTIENVEAGNDVIVPGVIDMICAALKVPVAILTIPMDKWLAVVNKAALTATELTKIKPNQPK